MGNKWPPQGISPLRAWELPLINTVILLISGATVTWAHHALMQGSQAEVRTGLIITALLGLLFANNQGTEYAEAAFDISDGAYGSTFFVTTGFHGLHVIIGAIFLIICFLRNSAEQFTITHHIGLEAAA